MHINRVFMSSCLLRLQSAFFGGGSSLLSGALALDEVREEAQRPQAGPGIEVRGNQVRISVNTTDGDAEKAETLMLLEPNVTVVSTDAQGMGGGGESNERRMKDYDITSLDGWQYAAFFTPSPADDDDDKDGKAYLNVARRQITAGESHWEVTTLRKHAVEAANAELGVSIDISKADATLHLLFGSRERGMRYSASKKGLVLGGESVNWHDENLFGEVVELLPGLERVDGFDLGLIWDAKFVYMSNRQLLWLSLSASEKRNGLKEASEMLCSYNFQESAWSYHGRYLVGDEGNMPSIRGPGVDWDSLLVSWVNKPSTQGQSAAANTTLHFATSKGGFEWEARKPLTAESLEEKVQKAMAGQPTPEPPMLADLTTNKEAGISSNDRRAFVSEGAIDLQDQAVCNGDLNVLTKEKLGDETYWKHYRRHRVSDRWEDHVFKKIELQPGKTKRQSQIVYHPQSTLFLILPGDDVEGVLTIIKRQVLWDGWKVQYLQPEVVWIGKGFVGDPIVDRAMMAGQGRLSIMTRLQERPRKTVVLDFQLTEDDVEWKRVENLFSYEQPGQDFFG